MEDATIVFESETITVEATAETVYFTGALYFDVAGQGIVSEKGPASVALTPADMKAIAYAWLAYIKQG